MSCIIRLASDAVDLSTASNMLPNLSYRIMAGQDYGIDKARSISILINLIDLAHARGTETTTCQAESVRLRQTGFQHFRPPGNALICERSVPGAIATG